MGNSIPCRPVGSLQVRCLVGEPVSSPAHIEDRDSATAFLADDDVRIAPCSKCWVCCHDFSEATYRQAVILTKSEETILRRRGFGDIIQPGPSIGSVDGHCQAFDGTKCSLPIEPLNCQAHTCASRFVGFEDQMTPYTLYWIRHAMFDLLKEFHRAVVTRARILMGERN